MVGSRVVEYPLGALVFYTVHQSTGVNYAHIRAFFAMDVALIVTCWAIAVAHLNRASGYDWRDQKLHKE
jgi:hypothetical protein